MGFLFILAHPSFAVVYWDEYEWDAVSRSSGAEVQKTVSSYSCLSELPRLERNIEITGKHNLPAAPYIVAQTCYYIACSRYNSSAARYYSYSLLVPFCAGMTFGTDCNFLIMGIAVAAFIAVAFVTYKHYPPYHINLTAKSARETEYGSQAYYAALNNSAAYTVSAAAEQIEKAVEMGTLGATGIGVFSAVVLALGIFV